MHDMPRKLPLHVCRERDRRGVLRFYFRRGKGKRTALPSPTDPGFMEAYQKALSAQPARKPVEARSGSLAWLVARYKESARFAALRPSTRRMRDNILKRVCQTAGMEPYSAISRNHIEQGMARRTPNAANNFRKVMNQLFTFAVDAGYRETNPVASVRPIRVETDGHAAWAISDIERYKEQWPLGTKERLAMDLLLFTGLRRSDIMRLGRQHLSGNTLSIKTQKTGKWVHVPVCEPLRQSIEATKTGDLAFITTARGLPFTSPASFGNWFADACKSANVDGRAHGLRKAGATIAAEEGATASELMAMYGWKKLDEAELYTRTASERRMAARAAERIANVFKVANDDKEKIQTRR